jgi:hypothetical protein
MRVLLAAAIGLTCATGAAAQALPDRYGPARSASVALAAYGGPMLTWASKTQAPQRLEPAFEAAPPAALEAPSQPTFAPPARAAAQSYAPGPDRMTTLGADAAPALPRQVPLSYAQPQAKPLPQPAPVAPARLAEAGAPTRYYSLHREYGLTPDPTPAQSSAPRYVLMGPPDSAPGTPSRDADSDSDTDLAARPF